MALDPDANHTYASEQSLVSQVLDYAIIALDPSGVITSWNAGAARVKGWTRDEAVGRHFSIFYPAADREAGLPQRLLEQARADGRVEHAGWRVRKDGGTFWGSVVITALHDADGTPSGFAKVTRDLTEQHRLAEALRQSEARLRLLVTQVVDYAIIALDPSGVIETWNLGAERVKGYPADLAIGQHFSIFYTAADREAGLPQRLLEQARTDGRVEHTGWRVRADGTLFWADVVITALHDDAGTLSGYAKVTRDLTEQHRLEEVQASLFATISHDLRTPITTIGVYASLIADSDHAERVEFAERILSNAEQLERLVSGLFDYAKLRAGTVDVRLEPVDLAAAARDALADLNHLSTGRTITIDDRGAWALVDRVAVRRVLDNVIVNALRYSEPGTPLELTCLTRGERVRLVLTDHGRGIDAADLPLIFSEFVRGRLATDDGGTGLGLASVRQLTSLQGGRVRLDSEVGVGTTVTLEFARTDRPPVVPET